MKQHMTSGINTSPTRAGEAGADMSNIGGKAVKFNEDGLLVLCDTKGEMPIGIVAIDNDAEVKKGDSVTYQIFAVGIAAISEKVTAGTELTTSTDGTLVSASDGDFVCAIAMNNCNANAMGTVRKVDYYKSAAKTNTEEVKNNAE
ncbi:hypothetical protein FMM68_03980 [Lachnospiraceae bacterium MD329]|nr:hypothetical protein [Lachnospiraceae bacterium MD329]